MVSNLPKVMQLVIVELGLEPRLPIMVCNTLIQCVQKRSIQGPK
jgi:hypothetical protein